MVKVTWEKALAGAERWEAMEDAARRAVIAKANRNPWEGYEAQLDSNPSVHFEFSSSGKTYIHWYDDKESYPIECAKYAKELEEEAEFLENESISLYSFAELVMCARRYDPYYMYCDRYEDEKRALRRNVEVTDKFCSIINLALGAEVEEIPDCCMNTAETEKELAGWMKRRGVRIYF